MTRTYLLSMLISLFFINVASAQQLPPNCAPLSIVVNKLLTEFKEVPLFSGNPGKNETIDPNQPLLIFFVNKVTGTYSAVQVITVPPGLKVGCLMTSGDHYNEDPIVPTSKVIKKPIGQSI